MRRWARTLRMLSLLCAWSLLLCAPAWAEEMPSTIRVVMDDNYPPFVFRDGTGRLQGVLVDQWMLWEQKTGVKVVLTATGWNRALQWMNEDRADVIDTIFPSPERQRIYDFSQPYARIDVPIFFHESIAGIRDLESLKGFQVAVKKGDLAEEKLRSGGVQGIVEFDSYEAIVDSAKQGRTMVFVMDKPPALYFLYKAGLQERFRQSQPLYSGEFRRAVHKGDAKMLQLVEKGFAEISKDEYEDIERRWHGSTESNVLLLLYLQHRLLFFASVGGLILVLLAWNEMLRRRVRKKTGELLETVAQLEGSEKKYRELLENLTVAVAVFSAQGELTLFNQTYLDLLGITEEEARKGRFREGWQYLLPNGEPMPPQEEPLLQVLKSGSALEDCLLGIRRRKQSEPIWLSATLFPELDAEGQVRQVVVTLSEVTQLKLAQQALLASEEKFSKIFRYSMDVIGLVRVADGAFMEVNDAFSSQLGYSLQDVIGKNSLEFSLWARPNEREEIQGLYRAAGKVFNKEVLWRRKDGELRTGILSAEVAGIGGEQYILFVWHDISERKLAEDALRHVNEELERKVEVRTQDLLAMNQELTAVNQELEQTVDSLRRTQIQLLQSEKLASLGSLVAGIAHEINTPVGIGVTASSHLQKMTRDFLQLYEAGGMKRQDLVHFLEDAEEASTIVYTNLERASRLIRSFKQVSADQSSEERRRFKVRQYMDEILLSMLPKLKKTAHRIQLNCPDELTIDGYPGAFSQVITNLVMNSLLHAYGSGQAGVISIDIQADGSDIHLRYADDGVGMEAAVVEKIFDPFFTTRRGEGGTGLGMHIIQNIVTQQFGGSIRCNSQPGQGTEFIIRFPQQREEKQHEQG
ncbi:PAS domain S-box protein [Azotosporobacter soli]|uniref:PAS domain S-box protein n=1 Tax=Azotosporobacter soli TaxID=3055040 RepID=UPI0031FF07C1